jgi:hypothetical protein
MILLTHLLGQQMFFNIAAVVSEAGAISRIHEI